MEHLLEKCGVGRSAANDTRIEKRTMQQYSGKFYPEVGSNIRKRYEWLMIRH